MGHFHDPTQFRCASLAQLGLILIMLDTVPQIHVRHLVSQHCGQLGFRFHEFEQPAHYEDLPARQGESIDLG